MEIFLVNGVLGFKITIHTRLVEGSLHLSLILFFVHFKSPQLSAVALLSFVVFLGLYAALVLKRPPSTGDGDQCTDITCVNARMDELCTFDALDIVFWVFVCGYKRGPNWRLIGGAPLNLSLMAMCVTSIVAVSKWISQIPAV